MSEWRRYKLGDVTVNFDSRRVPIKEADRKKGPYPYYGASGIIDHVDDYIFDGEYLLVAEDGENLRTRKLPIAFTATGQFWVNNHAHILQGNEFASTRYLAYLLDAINIGGYISGSTQPKLTRHALDRVAIALPDLSYQQDVVDVIGVLDNKISLDTHLAATAGELSSLATKYCHVCNGQLADIVELKREQLAPEAVDAAEVAHFSIPAFDQGQRPERLPPSEIKSSKFVITEPSVLVSKLNPSRPRSWLVDPIPDVPALASTEFLVLVPKQGIPASAVWAATSQPQFWDALGGKTTGTSNSHQRVRPADLLATEVVDVRHLDTEVVREIDLLCRRATAARAESERLAALRDALLPGLMSGRLKVRDAERAVEEAV